MTRKNGYIDLDKMIFTGEIKKIDITEETKTINNLDVFLYKNSIYFYKLPVHGEAYNELVSEEILKDFNIPSVEYDLASYWLSHASYVEPLDSAYYSNYTLDSLNFIDIKTYDDNNIVVVANYGVRYLYNIKNPNGTVDSQSYYNTYKLLLTLKKEGNTYKITNGFKIAINNEIKIM